MPPAQIPTSRKVARNTVFNAIGRFGSMALSLFMMPYIVGKLGEEAFGLWALLYATTDFARLFDLGIATAYMKHIAEFHAKGDSKSVNQVINTALFFSTALSAVFLVGGLALAAPLLHFFKCAEVPHAYFTLKGALLILVINYSLMVFRAVLNGLQRLDIVHAGYLATAFIGAACTIVLLQLGYGLRGLVFSKILEAALCSLVFLAGARRVFPEMYLGMCQCSWGIFKKLFRFGIQIQVAAMSETVNAQIDKVLLGHFMLKKAFIAFYDVGGRISGVVRSVSWALLGAIEPAAAELHASGRHEALTDLYVRASKYVFAATAPLCAFAFVFADEIMLLYMGKPGFELAAVAARFLVVAYCGQMFSGVARCVARGMGILTPEMGSSLVVLVLNAVLSVTLVMIYGFTGALTGTMVASVVGYLYCMTTFSRKSGFSLSRIVTEVYAGATVACAGSTCLSWLAVSWVSNLDLPANRIGYGLVFVCGAGVFFGAYAALVFAVRYVTFGEVASVIEALNLPFLERKAPADGQDD